MVCVTPEYVTVPETGARPNLVECPVSGCGKDLTGETDSADHFWTDHLPEGFGLAPLGVIDPSTTRTRSRTASPIRF